MAEMTDVALLVLRVVLGTIFLAHGSQRLFGAVGGHGLKGTAASFEQIGIKPGSVTAPLAALSEFGGGLLVLVGLLTPLGALAVAGTMVVAIAKMHGKNGFFTQKSSSWNAPLSNLSSFRPPPFSYLPEPAKGA